MADRQIGRHGGREAGSQGGRQAGMEGGRQAGRQAVEREREGGMHLLCMSARRRSSYASRNLLISSRSFSHFLRFAVVTHAHRIT
jgi:hypothetical protein